MSMNTSRRRFVVNAGGALLATVAGGTLPVQARSTVLYVNTWGGTWTAAEDAAFYKPFTAATGIQVRTVEPVSFAQLKEQVKSGNYQWDITSFTDGQWLAAQVQGLTEPIDFSIIDKSKLFPDPFTGSGVKSFALAINLTYRTDKYPASNHPKTWADFWDVKRFPGTRALYQEPAAALMMALLADGVPRDRLFPLDVDRAFRKLDEIKPHIKVWWTQNGQSKQLLRDGEVDMIAMLNAHVSELITEGVPCQMEWDGAVLIHDVWGVVRGAPNAKAAWQFVQFASQPERQADFARRVLYGPENPAAYNFLAPEVVRQFPTYPANLAVAAPYDAHWYVANYAAAKDRFTQWLAI